MTATVLKLIASTLSRCNATDTSYPCYYPDDALDTARVPRIDYVRFRLYSGFGAGIKRLSSVVCSHVPVYWPMSETSRKLMSHSV